MNTQQKIDELRVRFKSARAELEAEVERVLESKRERFKYTLKQGKAVFDREFKRLQRRERVSSFAYVLNAPISFWLSAPVIYGMIVPLVFLVATITLYQHICFRVYSIPRVMRSDYFIFDRHRLPYLNTVQKINCVYCGYANGLIAYAREILARTEQFWCPVKHALRLQTAHEREIKFFDYGDAEAWKKDLKTVRHDWEDSDNKFRQQKD